MALSTYNKFGHITVSDEAVAIIVSKAASECYGVVELVSRRFSDNLAKIFNKKDIRQRRQGRYDRQRRAHRYFRHIKTRSKRGSRQGISDESGHVQC